MNDVRHSLCELAGVNRVDQIDLVEIDGAGLLGKVFNALTDARWEFKKTRDVPIMVDWLLTNDLGSLDPLGGWLADLLGGADNAPEQLH